MNITATAIRNNRVTLLGLLVLLLAGVMAFLALPRAEDPGFTIRTAVVTTHYPGASPERVEQLVTDKLEKTIQEIPEIDFISSESRTGVSMIFVNIKESYTEMRPIWDDLRRKVENAQADLPDGVSGPYVNDEFGDVFPVMATITGDGYSYAELKDVADQVRDQLLRLPDVAKVDVYGAQDERIFVEYNNARLADVGLSPSQLRSELGARNIVVSGGTVYMGGEEVALEPSGNFESVDELARTRIPLPGGGVMDLGDLAHVERGYKDPPTAMMFDTGERCLGLAVSMREGGNVITMGEQVQALVTQLEAGFPWGVEIDLVLFQPAAVDKLVNDFLVNLLEAVAIVIMVMVFTLGLRTGLVVASLIPMAIFTTLMVMSTMGIGLEQISIAALIIALGMLVDNAIVMSESIMVQMGAGKKRFEAAVDSASELRIPLLTSSLTTAAAFLPIYLAESALGEFCASLFEVVAIALLSSWVLSLTMMPLLCMLFIRVPQTPADDSATYDSRFYGVYRGLLLGLVRRPWLSLAGVIVVFFVALAGLGQVPFVFMPKADSPRMVGEIDLPLGTSIEETQALVTSLDAFIGEELAAGDGGDEGFLSWSTYVGSQGGPRYRLGYNPAQAGSEHASYIFTATSRAFVDGAIPRLEAFCWEQYPSATTSWMAESTGPAGEVTVEVRLFGDEVEQLFGLVAEVKAQMAAMPGTRNIQDSWGPRTKKLLVNINQARARRAGVTSQDVATSLQSGLSGIETTEYREGDKVIPVIMRSVAADRHDIGKLESLNIFVQSSGASVPLKQVADVEVAWEASRILRRDRQKAVTVTSYLAPGQEAATVSTPLMVWLEEQSADWPLGFSYEMGGELEQSSEAMGSLAAKLPIAGFIILLLLVSQFNSMRRTFIVLFTIPLGLIGVTLGLLLLGGEMGFMTFLGVISLAGIIINNAIVLLDRIKLEIEENGLAPGRAVIEAAQRRLRPILLTTATTIGGLLPLYFFGGPMWESMSIAIMAGLAFATLLTLGVVPVLYTVCFKVRFTEFDGED